MFKISMFNLKGAAPKSLKITGSVSQREKVAQEMMNEFSQGLESAFEAKNKSGKTAVVSLKEMQKMVEGVIKKRSSDVLIDIQNAGVYGLSYRKGLSNEKSECIFQIPFENKNEVLKNGDTNSVGRFGVVLGALFHKITQPKSTMRDVTFFNNLSEDKLIGASTFHSYFVEKMQVLTEDENAGKEFFKTAIKEFFKEFKFYDHEKIDTLQFFRNRIKQSINAERAGINLGADYQKKHLREKYPNAFERDLQEAKDNVFQKQVVENLQFPLKLKAVDEVFAEELKSARKINNIKYQDYAANKTYR